MSSRFESTEALLHTGGIASTHDPITKRHSSLQTQDALLICHFSSRQGNPKLVFACTYARQEKTALDGVFPHKNQASFVCLPMCTSVSTHIHVRFGQARPARDNSSGDGRRRQPRWRQTGRSGDVGGQQQLRSGVDGCQTVVGDLGDGGQLQGDLDGMAVGEL